MTSFLSQKKPYDVMTCSFSFLELLFKNPKNLSNTGISGCKQSEEMFFYARVIRFVTVKEELNVTIIDDVVKSF